MSWFGQDAPTLERVFGLPRVLPLESVESTMDEAHALAAAGAPAGSFVIAESQQRGRGRGGNRWMSAPRAGIWMTLVERPNEASGLDVLSLRVGLRMAPVLERWSRGPIRLKWPNDLFVGDAKLAGVLIEARWRDGRPDWVAIGVGINLAVPADFPTAAALHEADAVSVVAELLPALRSAAFARTALSEAEREEFARRDYARGRRITEPLVGTVQGISPDGALLVESEQGLTPCRAGSLVFAS